VAEFIGHLSTPTLARRRLADARRLRDTALERSARRGGQQWNARGSAWVDGVRWCQAAGRG